MAWRDKVERILAGFSADPGEEEEPTITEDDTVEVIGESTDEEDDCSGTMAGEPQVLGKVYVTIGLKGGKVRGVVVVLLRKLKGAKNHGRWVAIDRAKNLQVVNAGCTKSVKMRAESGVSYGSGPSFGSGERERVLGLSQGGSRVLPPMARNRGGAKLLHG